MNRYLGLALWIAFAVPAHAIDKPKYKGRLVPGDWMMAWTGTLQEELRASPLLNHTESQIERLCPGYTADRSRQKRILFWSQLMISLAWRESLHGPENYVEFRGGTNDGLYQINPELLNAYRCGQINTFNPIQNIQCGVKMATKLVLRFGSFLKGAKEGMAAYWQPLRATSAYNRRNRNFILAATTEACRAGALSYHSTNMPAWLGDVWPSAEETFNDYNVEEDVTMGIENYFIN